MQVQKGVGSWSAKDLQGSQAVHVGVRAIVGAWINVARNNDIIHRGNAATAQLLRDHGMQVHEYQASEINKGEGGPTCLTRPILREQDI